MQINLLPPEIRQRQRARRLTFVAVAVGVVVLLIVGGVYLLQSMRIEEAREQLAAQEARNAQLRAEIAQLENIRALQLELQQARQLVAELLANEVRWSGVLRDISLVIPGQAWLTGLTGTLAEEQAAGTPTAPLQGQGLVGNITFNGLAFDHRTVALWLSRLGDVRGFVNPWLSSSSKTTVGLTEVVQFNSSIDLSSKALARERGAP